MDGFTTVKALAEELCLSKVSVNNRIDKLNLRDELVKSGNRFLIPDSTADAIRESFATNRKTEPPAEDAMVQMLKEQVQQKDEQIASLLRQLELLQNQNTDLLKMQRESHYLLAQSMGIKEEQEPVKAETVLDPDEKQPQELPKKKSIFSRLFG